MKDLRSIAHISALWLFVGLSFVASLPAWAIHEKTPEPDWRYAVVDVRPGSTLNLRAQPGSSSPVVGQLAYDASGLVVTGVRQEVGGGVWWQVPYRAEVGESTLAWVNARYLAPVDAFQERERDFPLHCAGTEPFWSLTIEPGGDSGVGIAIFSRLGEEEARWPAGAWRMAEGQQARFAVPLDPRADEEMPGDGDVQIQGYAAVARDYRFCSDGMSDMQHPYEVMLMTPAGAVLSGCCRRAGEQ